MSQQETPDDSDRSSVTRRKALAIGGIGAAGLFSGCLGDGDDEEPEETPSPRVETVVETVEGGEETVIREETVRVTDSPEETESETPSETPHDSEMEFVENTEFRVAGDTDPLNVTMFDFGDWNSYHDSQLEAEPPGATQEPTVIGLWRLHNFQNELGREGEGRLFAGWEFDTDHEPSEDNPQTVDVHIREDAMWSDGTEITAEDLMVNWGIKRLRVSTNDDDQDSFFPASGGQDWRNNWDRIEMPDGPDGKTVRVISEGKGQTFNDATVSGLLGYWSGGRIELDSPANHEDIQPMAEDVKTALEEGYNNPLAVEEWDQRKDIIQRHVDDDLLERWRNGDVAVTQGAWRLDEIRGSQEIVLEKNPHYRRSEKVNFDRHVIEYNPDESRKRASLQSGLLDAGNVSMTEAAASNLPDKYELVKAPGGGPGVIKFNHAHFAFQHREVRWAIAFAIDQEAVANNVNPAGTEVIDYPGAQVSNHEFLWDMEFIQENFINYSQDLERADALMQEAGFERNSNGVWENDDGQTMSFNFFTASSDPVYEITVRDQLNSWGCEVEVQTLEETQLDERRDNGELDFYASGGSLNGHIGNIDSWWGHGILLHRDYINRHNIYDREAMEDVVSNYPDSGWVYDNWTHFDSLTLDIPDFSEPDGETKPIPISYELAKSTLGPEPREGRDIENWEGSGQHPEFWELAAWATNWYLPAYPIYGEVAQYWLNTENFIWPTDHPMWGQLGFSIFVSDFMSIGEINANPDNPKSRIE